MAENKKDCVKWIPKVTTDDIKRKFPISKWLPSYSLEKLQGDIIAGITVGFMVIPQSLAMASIAGVPPEYGLYSSFPALFVYALLGTSNQMTVGPTVMISLMTKRYIGFANSPSIASVLSFVSGIILLFLGIFRLGFVVRFIPTPVISGFVSAAAIIIAVSQLKDIFGLTNAPRPFFERFAHFLTSVKDTVPGDIGMGLVCLVFLIGIQIAARRQGKDIGQHPKWKVIGKAILRFTAVSRSALVAILATFVSYLFHINGHDRIFTLAGELPKGLPEFKFPLQSVPLSGNNTISVKEMISGFGSGIGMMPLIIFIESIAVAKALARRHNYKIDPSQELIALGIGNIFGSFFTGFPTTGSFSRSAVNSMSGAVTPFASIVTGSVVLLAIAFVTHVFQYIPKAALGAMVFAAVLTMIEFKLPKKLWRINRLDLLPFAVSFIGCFYELEMGILAGVGVAIMIILYREVRPRMTVDTDDEGETVVLKINGGVWFPGADNITNKLLSLVEDPDNYPSVIQIDCTSMYEIDYTTALAFRQAVMEVRSKDVEICKPDISFINVRGENVRTVLREIGLLSTPEDDKSNADENEKCVLLEKGNLYHPAGADGTPV